MVDKQADNLLQAEVAALRAMPRAGTFDAVIAGKPIRGTWDHINMPNGIHQIVYRLERSHWISLSLYFNGVEVLLDGKVQLLNIQELGYFEL
ncbi:hypothetical protein [Hymenobacter lapidiphilus]|uniref:Uncharacterized protein n=1 Tax=Hymenobacter lapidiphilus TaxID=2608003 RepID=A0A7Y7PSB5_9BACT|nr:hypothetical protein [Hymenobacter lapidiphilus]NVO33114.1 hypothetical protein [Hymenobacter lapidiphilus]